MSDFGQYRLFVDKYCPQTFNQIAFNQGTAQHLIACAKSEQMPHLIIKGADGSGRKTFANLYVKAKYGEHVKTRYQTITISHTSKVIELQMLYSDYHYQIDPSLHGVYDRVIVQGFIKDILQTKPICQIPYHLIIIANADKLTMEAQQSLRRTLEKNMSTCRFIFLINQESALIESLNSRCVQLRLSAPTDIETIHVLDTICHAEGLHTPTSQLQQIATYANRNLSKAINCLQYLILNHPTQLTQSVTINFHQMNPIDGCLYTLVQSICAIRTPIDLMDLRQLFHELLIQCIDPLKIMKNMFYLLMEQVTPTQLTQLIPLLAKYENTMKQGSKPIYHLEAFCLGVAMILRN